MLSRASLIIAGLSLVSWLPDCVAKQPSTENVCSDAIMEVVGEYFQLSQFSNDGLLTASVCRRWPIKKDQEISAFVYGSNNEDKLKLLIAIVDTRREKVVASYIKDIENDATERFERDSLKLDFAKYQLAKDVRAFALREHTFHDRCTYEGGADDFLRLFVIEKNAIRPVFENYMSEWSYGLGNRCAGEDTTITENKYVIKVSNTISNGFSDLTVTEKGNSQGAFYRYNGCRYINMPLNQPLAQRLCEK